MGAPNAKRLAAAVIAAAWLWTATPAAAADPEPPKLPAPTYQSVSKEILIPMDDGVNIAATVALPSRDGKTPLPGRYPVVLGMTPYGRTGVCGCYPPDFWATRGIAGAVADVRGTGGSGGNLEGNYFSPRETRDSAAVIDYLGSQPYSSGKVGMAGGSYVGITQYLAAARRPRHLAAIAPQVALSDLYRDAYAHGGVPNLFFDTQYIAVQGAPGAAGPNSDPALLEATLMAKLGQSPPGTIAFDYLSRPNDDPFYRDRSPIYSADAIQVPTLIVGGWSDGLSQRGGPEMYRRLARRRGVETRLYMDPCTHKGCAAPFAPLTDPPGVYDVGALVFEFLSKHLRGTRAPERPPVEYYVQSKGRYAASDRWPPTTATRRLELVGDALRNPASGGDGSGRYISNPAAGFSMAFDKYGTVAATPYVPTDQRLEGPQGLTFRTAPLSRPLDLAGPIGLHLDASSTAPDTDWIAKLADVAPDGSESIVTQGALRASHRSVDTGQSTAARPYHGHTGPTPIEPNRFYDYDVEIWPTAYQLKPGHRLQLRVTSTDLPTHLPGSYFLDRSRPLDTRVDLQQPAANTVRFRSSYLTLPTDDTGTGPAGAGHGRAWRGGRRSVRATSAASGSGTHALVCGGCPCARRGAPGSATATA